MTPRWTGLNRAQIEVNESTADEPSDTSRMDTADLDYTDCQLETDVCDESSQASQALSNKGEVACMSDFDDADFNDTGFDSDVGSSMEFDWNTRNDAYVTNPGGRIDSDQDRRRLYSLSLSHQPQTQSINI